MIGKADLNMVRGYQVEGGAWSTDGGLVIVALQYRLPNRESAPPRPGSPTQRLIAFDAQGNLVADMGRSSYRLIVIGKDRVSATSGMTISNWKRSDLTRPEKKIAAKAGIAAMVLSPDETRLAYAWNGGVAGDPSATGNVVVYDLATGANAATWQADTRVKDLVWHPGGAMVATAGEHGAKVWRVDGTEIGAVVAQAATAVAFTPDGAELLVATAGTAPKVVRVDLPAAAR